jgi:hypothetical protein
MSEDSFNKPDYDKLIDCAAIKMPDGRVWTGKRHHHCIATIFQATGQRAIGGIQGFVTMSKKFVDREEAFKIAFSAGQIKDPSKTRGNELYSEDLY